MVLLGAVVVAGPARAIVVAIPAFPKALLDYVAFDELAEALNYYLLEPLVEMDTRSYAPTGILADTWKISPDHLRYTFHLRPEAHFSDGQPVTAHDVKFTWDAIQNPRFRMVPYQELFASFTSCEVKDERTVEFRAVRPHFKNLEKLSELLILPQHVYQGADLGEPYPKRVIGSGPYTLSQVKLGETLTLTRDPRYWGQKLAARRGRFQLPDIVFKTVADRQVEAEMLSRGDVDFVSFTIAKIWATQTSGPAYQSGKVHKLRVQSALPFGSSGIAWNLRRKLFADRRVRWALGLLLDRTRFLHELFYDAYVPSSGFLKYDSLYHAPRVVDLPYDPARAGRLLQESGWGTVGPDGVRVKDGQRFEFEILAKEPAAERFLTLYQESLRKMGILMHVRIQDWASSLRRMDARDFDGYLVHRTRDVEPSDFALTWGSETADQPGSRNVTGFKDAELDRLAAELDRSFDRRRRVQLARRIDEILYREQPETFTWEQTELRIGYRDGYRFVAPGYDPYSRWYQIFARWTFDPGLPAPSSRAAPEGPVGR
jgi:ABC-type transport system substrate-binding protein